MDIQEPPALISNIGVYRLLDAMEKLGFSLSKAVEEFGH